MLTSSVCRARNFCISRLSAMRKKSKIHWGSPLVAMSLRNGIAWRPRSSTVRRTAASVDATAPRYAPSIGAKCLVSASLPSARPSLPRENENVSVRLPCSSSPMTFSMRPGSVPAMRSKITRRSGSNVTFSRSGTLFTTMSRISQPAPRSTTSHFCMIGTNGRALLAFIPRPTQTSCLLSSGLPGSLTGIVRESLYIGEIRPMSDCEITAIDSEVRPVHEGGSLTEQPRDCFADLTWLAEAADGMPLADFLEERFELRIADQPGNHRRQYDSG